MEVTSRHQNLVQIFADSSKVDEKVAAAAVSSVAPNSPFYNVDCETTVLFTQRGYKQFCLLLSKFVIFSDAISALQAREKIKKTDHPLLRQIKDMLHTINVDQKAIVFMWVTVHVSIRGNEAAGRAAKAHDKEPKSTSCPFQT